MKIKFLTVVTLFAFILFICVNKVVINYNLHQILSKAVNYVLVLRRRIRSVKRVFGQNEKENWPEEEETET